jgi:hypothetical protein
LFLFLVNPRCCWDWFSLIFGLLSWGAPWYTGTNLVPVRWDYPLPHIPSLVCFSVVGLLILLNYRYTGTGAGILGVLICLHAWVLAGLLFCCWVTFLLLGYFSVTGLLLCLKCWYRRWVWPLLFLPVWFMPDCSMVYVCLFCLSVGWPCRMCLLLVYVLVLRILLVHDCLCLLFAAL